MQVFTSFKNIPESARGGVVVIGNFDGVHRGHAALLEKAKTIAARENAPLAVLTFEPHPRKLFRPDDPPFRITPPDLKAERLEKTGVDILYQIEFDWEFASLRAEDFIRRVLTEGIRPVHIVVGYDFRFGQMRGGSAETLESAGLEVTVVGEVAGASSTNIREALRRGDIRKANELLGWEWEIRGKVMRGDQRGRTLGFPTANFPLGEIAHPAYGVYAARVRLQGGAEWRPAAVNIGIKPMFEVSRAEVESHIFDFNREIYGETLEVRPVQFLRSEAKFNTLEELKKQIAADCGQVRDVLGC